MTTPPDWTDEDAKLHHTTLEHLIEGAYAELVVALEEAIMVKNRDERYAEMFLALPPIMEQIMALANDMMDQIPGLISLDEAQQEAESLFRQLAIEQGLPADSFLPDDEKLH
jgi:hypothetical protein